MQTQKSNTDALTKAIRLLHDQTPRILKLEATDAPTERDAALLRAFGRVARGCAVQKGIAVAGSDKTSDLIRRLTLPLSVVPKTTPPEETEKSRRESDQKSVKVLKSLAQKSAAFDPSIRDDLASELLAICRRRGLVVSSGASPEELLNRLRPLLIIEGQQRKTTAR